MMAAGTKETTMPIGPANIVIVPKLKKGQLVRVRQGVCGTRALTSAERNAWYEKFYEDCRAGRDVWHDSAGESRLAPSQTDTDFSVGKILTVTVASASPKRVGMYFSGRGRYCLVLDTVTGQEWMVAKRYLEVV
jgi:hypothetical protein